MTTQLKSRLFKSTVSQVYNYTCTGYLLNDIFPLHCPFLFSVVRYVIGETTLSNGNSPENMPDKATQQKEKELLYQFQVRHFCFNLEHYNKYEI